MTERMLPLALPALLLAGLTACQVTAPPAEPVTPGSDRYSQKYDGPPDKQLDVFSLPEPTPVHEERSRWGNHSPYTVFGVTYEVLPTRQNYSAEGIASWYGSKFHGHRTSSGETYDMYQFTAAHRSLPLPAWARVTNLDNGESLIVRVNDRGPFHPDREIDLSWAAAERLGIARAGTGRVLVESITPEPVMVSNPVPQPAPSRDIAGANPNHASATALYLQVGAFSQLDSASHLADRLLASVDQPVAIRPGISGDNRVYRVWVGPFGSESVREQARQALSESGFGESVRVSPQGASE